MVSIATAHKKMCKVYIDLMGEKNDQEEDKCLIIIWRPGAELLGQGIHAEFYKLLEVPLCVSYLALPSYYYS